MDVIRITGTDLVRQPTRALYAVPLVRADRRDSEIAATLESAPRCKMFVAVAAGFT